MPYWVHPKNPYKSEILRRYRVLWLIDNNLYKELPQTINWHNYINYLGIVGENRDGTKFVTDAGRKAFLKRESDGPNDFGDQNEASLLLFKTCSRQA
jgi:hypothetical protein